VFCEERRTSQETVRATTMSSCWATGTVQRSTSTMMETNAIASLNDRDSELQKSQHAWRLLLANSWSASHSTSTSSSVRIVSVTQTHTRFGHFGGSLIPGRILSDGGLFTALCSMSFKSKQRIPVFIRPARASSEQHSGRLSPRVRVNTLCGQYKSSIHNHGCPNCRNNRKRFANIVSAK
jgi:hypothetical protein